MYLKTHAETMPYRRRRRRSRRRPRPRRRYRRRRTRLSKRRTIRRMPVLLPDRIKVKLKYCAEIVLSGDDQYLFSQNGIFDPNVTGTGHQPMYMDFYTAQYGNYYVPFSTIKLISNTEPANTATGFLGVLCTDGSLLTAYSNVHYRELPSVRYKFLPLPETRNFITVRNSMSTAKYHGMVRDINSISAPVGAQPSAEAYWSINQYRMISTGPFDNIVSVQLYYTVIFFNRNKLPALN